MVHCFPVSVKGVVIVDGKVVLLKKERDEWELPGGKLELGEAPQACVAREVREQLNLIVTTGALLDAWHYHIFDGADVVVITYGCHVVGSRQIVCRDEHREAGPFSPEQISGLPMPDGYKRSILAWISQSASSVLTQHGEIQSNDMSAENEAETTLRTDRLVLAPLHPDHVDDLFNLYDDPAVAFFMLPGPNRRADVLRNLLHPDPWRERPRFGVFLDGRLVGDVVLEIDRREATANLGYAIGREFWGRGIATEAARAVVDYGFRVVGLAKVCARADPRNVGSVRVMEKLGMRREALLRSHVVRRGERCDRVWYGVLREEWNVSN